MCLIMQGRFEIVALSGHFSNYEVNGSINRTGSLTVALVCPSGQILGGTVGQLVAATPVQVTKHELFHYWVCWSQIFHLTRNVVP